MFSRPVIRAAKLSKCYQLYDRPADRLRQLFWGRRRRYFREFWALRDVDLEVAPGEVLGVVGRNGAGKSTLLQLLCGTLSPSSGTVEVDGRVAALLELGAGFNPEFTGRENIYLSASILGLSRDETDARYEEIVEFSGIRDFIDQPIKTYSSGMYVRLAFSVATSVEPDILVIDEALSVGDGEFARKSFDRIMTFRDAGKTILFCSHAIFQVEALCSRVLWLADGQPRMLGDPKTVIAAYDAYLSGGDAAVDVHGARAKFVSQGTARLADVRVAADGTGGTALTVRNGETTVSVAVAFASDPGLPTPSVAVCIVGQDGRIVTSTATFIDRMTVRRNADGTGEAVVTFPAFPLLKGRYFVDVYLMCEKGVFVYDLASRVAELHVVQECLTQGVVATPHRWAQAEAPTGATAGSAAAPEHKVD